MFEAMMQENDTREGRGELLLVRHTQIAEPFRGKCYGASDIPLSPEGEVHARELAAELAFEQPALVVHSGLSRARFLAEEVARHAGISAVVDPRLREMNFGAWELRTWDDIFSDVGHRMARLIHEPDTICSDGAESANEVRRRMVSWAQELGGGSLVVAVSHGGPISALRGTLNGSAAAKWPDLMPSYGEVMRFALPLSLGD